MTANEQWLSLTLKQEFIKKQAKNAVTLTLIQWLKKASRPGADQMEGVGRELKYYWARFDELSMEDGVLGICNPVDDGPEL